jgi:hypothetical protein
MTRQSRFLPDTVSLMVGIRHPMYSHGTSNVGVPAYPRDTLTSSPFSRAVGRFLFMLVPGRFPLLASSAS